MARKKQNCTLPALRRPARLREGDLTDTQLAEILRRIALNYRAAEGQPFYPLRDAARHLDVPFSALRRVYARLSKEGLLTSMRGSGTLLEGRRAGRRLNIKSFIGLPISSSCFMTLQDYQCFYFELRREAQSRGFVSNMIFYKDTSRGLEELRTTLDEFGVDSVIWFLPRSSVRETVLSLKESGTLVLGIADGGSPGLGCRYEIHREKAFGAILRHWRSHSGITSITIARVSRRSPADEEMIEAAAEKAGLAYDYRHIRANEIAEAVASLGNERKHGIVLPAAPAALLSLRAPEAFARLLKSCRVALPDGPTTSLLAAPPDTPVDLLTVDWRHVAKKIVGDILRKRAFRESPATVFEAVPRYQVPLHRYLEVF
jgi:hypothetical protein